MQNLRFTPLPTDHVTALRHGGLDAYGLPPERVVSDGGGNPCRHCLDYIPKGEEMLILAHRPIAKLHPSAETGPIFLCARDCAPWQGAGLPPILNASPDYLLKAYGSDERIIYGTGRVTPKDQVAEYAAELLVRDGVAFVDLRSARNNCFQIRIRRAGEAA